MSLTPPDLKQCQADVPGNGPFTMGGEIGDPKNGYRVRCKNTPSWVATESSPGKDGECGSMSLCDQCKDEFIKQLGPSFAYFSRIGRQPVQPVQPMQPIVLDEKGTPRFKGNEIIKHLFNTGKLDLNELTMLVHQGKLPKEDYVQITQLLGYSVSGWGDLSTSPPEMVEAADREAVMIINGDKEKYVECARKAIYKLQEDVGIDPDYVYVRPLEGECWVTCQVCIPEEEI